MTICIEYNDWELRQFNPAGEILYADIAAGSTASGNLSFGTSAWSHARTHPQQFNARFLTSVNAEPIQGDMRPAKNQADLIYHQLKALSGDAQHSDPTLLAVPGYLTDDQLGLLLGIAEQAGLKVSGFVDLSLIQALSESINQPCLVLDVELHRLVVTELMLDGNTLSAGPCRNVDGVGLISILDGWMNLIADQFVHQTRFDPMHTGACEQQLLNQLTDWLSRKEIGNRIAIEHNDVLREIDLEHQVVLDKLQQRIEGLFRFVQPGSPAVLVTQRAQSLPGLPQLLKQQGIQCRLANASLPNAGLGHIEAALPENEIVRVTSASVDPAETAIDTDTPANATSRVTHLLSGHQAYSINDARFAGVDVTQLQPGQNVTVDQSAYIAIEVN